jgi:hypothetical protein
MSAAVQIVASPEITQAISWGEICAWYPDQWVCLVELDRLRPHSLPFRTARVVGHGKTQREALRMAVAWWDAYPEIEHAYTGRVDAPVPAFLR